MSNLNTESGINNCYFNIDSKCTNPKINHKPVPDGSGRIWNSKLNCVYTQDGAQCLCSEYKFQKIYTETV